MVELWFSTFNIILERLRIFTQWVPLETRWLRSEEHAMTTTWWKEGRWAGKRHTGARRNILEFHRTLSQIQNLTSGSPILSPCSDHGSGPGTQEFQYSFIPSIPSCSLSCALSGPPTHPLRSCLVVTSTGRPSLVLQIKLGFPVICSRSILGLLWNAHHIRKHWFKVCSLAILQTSWKPVVSPPLALAQRLTHRGPEDHWVHCWINEHRMR